MRSSVRRMWVSGYMCFKLRPNLLKLQQVMTPQFLLDNCDAELK